MTARPGKITLCDECRLDNGWHYPEDGEPFRPHHGEVTAAKITDEALAATVAANEGAFRDALRIIAGEAEVSQWVNGNTTREKLRHAGISREDGNSGVIGLAFRRLYEEGVLEPDGMIRSDDLHTHGHRITQWRSRSFAPAQLGMGA
jgi:hypothetical protein